MLAPARLPRMASMAVDRLKTILLSPRARRVLASRRPPSGTVPFAVYFADVPSSAYQLRQWLRPLEALDSASGPVMLIVRNPSVALAMAGQTRLPMLFAQNFASVEDFITRHAVRVVFYVNNSQSNFTTLRLNGPAHVHLSHGESEKVSMYSNQLKAYDYAFIAGEASAARILEHVRGIDPAHLVRIGRPQLDVPRDDEHDATGGDGRATILYSPTWEGDSTQMAYGSLVSHGRDLVEALFSDPRFRIVFRPHPKTGTQSAQHRAALAGMKRSLSSPAARAAGHVIDSEPDAVRSIARADVVVADVSAMAMDALGMDKPLVLCQPTSHGTGELASRIATWATAVPAEAADQLARFAHAPVPAEQAAYRATVFATQSPAQAVQLFVDEATRIAQRHQDAAV